MIIVFKSGDTGQEIAFSNNTTAIKRMKQSARFTSVNSLGKYTLGYPTTQVKTTNVSGEDGLTIDSVKYTKRTITFSTDFAGLGEIQISRQRQQFGSILNSKNFRGTMFFYRDNDEGAEQYFTLKRVVGKITYESADGKRLSNNQFATFSFEAHDPFFYDIPKVATFFNSLEGLGKEYPFEYPFEYALSESELSGIQNNGDIDIPFIATFTGLFNSPELQNRTISETIKIKDGIDIPDTEQLVVDTDTRTIKINGVNSFDYLDDATRFYKLLRGANEIVFKAGNNNPINSVKLEYQEKYITI